MARTVDPERHARLRPAEGEQPTAATSGSWSVVLDLRLVDQRPDRHASFIPAPPRPRHPDQVRGLLALIGVFDIVGTVASGWLTDRVDSRYLLFTYYFLRGLSLLVVPWLLASTVHPSLFVFIVFYGLDWVATVPPTVALCRQHFGPEKAGIVFGWVFASHMVGAGIAASYAGWVRQEAGDYFAAWMTAGGLCLGAAALCLLIPRAGPGRAGRDEHRASRSPTSTVTGATLTSKSSGFQSRFSTRTIQLPELSRQTASTPYGRSDGSCMNSTPLAQSSSKVLRQSSTSTPTPAMPPSSCARRIASTRWSAIGGPGAVRWIWSSGWDGCTTVHQR